MKRIIWLILGLSLVAASCNKQPSAIIKDEPVGTIEVPAPSSSEEELTAETTKETKPESPKSNTFKIADLTIPKTEDEQDFQIDQNTIKNVEQDSKLDDHENRINNLENSVKNPPINSPVVQPVTPDPEPPQPTKTTYTFPENFYKTMDSDTENIYIGFRRAYGLSPEILNTMTLTVIGSNGDTKIVNKPVSIYSSEFWFAIPKPFTDPSYTYTVKINSETLEGTYTNHFSF